MRANFVFESMKSLTFPFELKDKYIFNNLKNIYILFYEKYLVLLKYVNTEST